VIVGIEIGRGRNARQNALIVQEVLAQALFGFQLVAL
jgi:hypothetical protein